MSHSKPSLRIGYEVINQEVFNLGRLSCNLDPYEDVDVAGLSLQEIIKAAIRRQVYTQRLCAHVCVRVRAYVCRKDGNDAAIRVYT